MAVTITTEPITRAAGAEVLALTFVIRSSGRSGLAITGTPCTPTERTSACKLEAVHDMGAFSGSCSRVKAHVSMENE
jgi:hypothetical protein